MWYRSNKNEAINIRFLSPEDANDVFEIYSDPQVTKNTNWERESVTFEAIKDFVDGLAKLGGGDPVKGAEIMAQKGGILLTPNEAKPVLLEIIKNYKNPEWVQAHGGGTLKGLFVIL